MARILYLGAENFGSTSRYRADALRRLGHHVLIADPYLATGYQLRNRWMNALHYRSGYRLLQFTMKKWVTNVLSHCGDIDIVWVDSGELLGLDCIRLLARAGAKVVLYNHDDPTGKRDGRRFDSLLAAIPAYDVCAVVREQNVCEFKAHGARTVVHVWRSYDETMHNPYADLKEIPEKFRSEVAFIGTWIKGERRDEFLMELVRRGVPLAIWGARWEKSPHWDQLKAYYKGGNLAGREYVAAIQGAKLCLGLLSKGNRDLHTTRTMEIPYAGGVLCAERTTEHMELFEDGEEAIFWGDVDECARHCRTLLRDDARRISVLLAGMAKIRKKGIGNEDVCRILIDTAMQATSDRAGEYRVP